MENTENNFDVYLDEGKINLCIDGIDHTLTTKTAIALRAELFKAIGNLKQDKLARQMV